MWKGMAPLLESCQKFAKSKRQKEEKKEGKRKNHMENGKKMGERAVREGRGFQLMRRIVAMINVRRMRNDAIFHRADL